MRIGANASHQTRTAAQALAESLRHISLAVNGPSELGDQFRKRVSEDPGSNRRSGTKPLLLTFSSTRNKS